MGSFNSCVKKKRGEGLRTEDLQLDYDYTHSNSQINHAYYTSMHAAQNQAENETKSADDLHIFSVLDLDFTSVCLGRLSTLFAFYHVFTM